ncbi:MAG: nucleotidyltransferase [Opitutales bacterium]|nr:nucleotidyltransferase [Opitutales bacterium]
MKKASFDAICKALQEAHVPFLVVGGIAVIHHGYGRLTRDVDLVIRLERGVIQRAFAAFESIGYRPSVPISANEFADPACRERWKREKGMKVLKFWSDQHRETPVDVFVDEPFDFQKSIEEADTQETSPGVEVRIVSLETLLSMKAAAGRPQDLADIDELNLLHGNASSYDLE